MRSLHGLEAALSPPSTPLTRPVARPSLGPVGRFPMQCIKEGFEPLEFTSAFSGWKDEDVLPAEAYVTHA